MAPRAISTAPTARLPQADGVILRLRTGGDGWAEDIPPAPPHHLVTVTFTTLDARALHADAIDLLGYRVAGIRPCPFGEPYSYADLLVPPDLAESRIRWWYAISERADRVFNVRAGPVAMVFADVLAAHRAVHDGTGGSTG